MGAQFRMRALPIIEWPCETGDPKAILLCVHGLGLENRAFGSFAANMVKRGFGVYAMDVRGFGAWQSEYGTQRVNFPRTMNDVTAVIRLIKYRQPGVPVFLVGESMGGAIVLNAASRFGEDMTGAIASVPSNERKGGLRMSIETALHLVRNPKQPFDIGAQVVEQATAKSDLRELWMNDPKAKMELTPVELIKFDKFMKETEKRCAEIHKTPTVVVQGMADKLVKPQGTYDMFDTIASADKTMIIVGNAEHLIFETTKQSQVLMDGLSAWIDNHLKGMNESTK
jgi:alpha-beta hydrolase superfamily lysophospholipase